MAAAPDAAAPAAAAAGGPSCIALQADGHPGVAFRPGSPSADPTHTIPNGQGLRLLEAGEEWSRVQYRGREGFVKSRNIRCGDPTELAAVAQQAAGAAAVAHAEDLGVLEVRVAQQGDGHPSVAMRRHPSKAPVADIPNGTELDVFAYEGEWAGVLYAGEQGWVKDRNLRPAPSGGAAGGGGAAPSGFPPPPAAGSSSCGAGGGFPPPPPPGSPHA
eukprot:TRINITY_DN6091_c3_g3_i1.p1 TRINITY_DN6091_c3_g3~~TRINITY_DN6091_c3_g3_i1.p1  ORF type:complete len:238 (+),score=64.20 TRINITY_DN6091_c3_g3_i1:69-716(+)